MAAHNPSRAQFYARAAGLLLLFWAALLRFMVMLPPLEGTDEIAHFGYIAYVRQNNQFPPLETDNPIVLQETGQPPLYYALAVAWSLLEPDYDWHTWQGVLLHNPWADFNKPVASLDNINQFMLGANHIPDADSPSIERAIAWLRFPSLLMGMLSVACAIAAAQRLFSPATALFAGMLFAFTMTLVLMFSFVTNDALITLAGTAVTYGCVRILTSSASGRSTLRPYRVLFFTGVMAAVGVLTKAGGLLFLPVMGVALLLSPQFSVFSFQSKRTQSNNHPSPLLSTQYSALSTFLKHALILLLIPALAAALWYGYMLLTYNDPFGMAAHLNRSWVRTEPIDIMSALPLNDFLSFRSFWGGMANGYLIPANWIFGVPLLLVGLGIVGGIRNLRATNPGMIHHAPTTTGSPVGAPANAPEIPNRPDNSGMLYRLYTLVFPYRVLIVLALIFGGMVAAYARWMTQFYVLSGRLMLPGVGSPGTELEFAL